MGNSREGLRIKGQQTRHNKPSRYKIQEEYIKETDITDIIFCDQFAVDRRLAYM